MSLPSAMRMVVALLLQILAVVPAIAQDPAPDQVTLQLPGRSSRVTIRCEVLDYTGEKIILATQTGVPRKSYPADQVVEVRTPQTPGHVRGLALFAAGQIEPAQRALNQALLDETRAWVRRDILAMLCRCALWEGRYTDAATRFILLTQSDPRTHHFGLIPLIWTPASLSRELEGQAKIWLTHSSAVARLMACSILLTDPDLGASARAGLRQLSVAPHPHVPYLARAQIWRTRLRGGGPGPEELEGWQSAIEAMPESVRGGPWFVLGQARLARNESERAAAALLWLPLIYPQDRHLAARAAIQAAESLAAAGEAAGAGTVYREVVTRFGSTSFAQDARAALAEMQPAPGAAAAEDKSGDARGSRDGGGEQDKAGVD